MNRIESFLSHPKLVKTIPVTDAAAFISATNFTSEMPVDVID